MMLRKFERRNCGGKSPVSNKYQNLCTFKEELILLCQSILETRRITHLHGSAHFRIPLNHINFRVRCSLYAMLYCFAALAHISVYFNPFVPNALFLFAKFDELK